MGVLGAPADFLRAVQPLEGLAQDRQVGAFRPGGRLVLGDFDQHLADGAVQLHRGQFFRHGSISPRLMNT